MKRRYTKEIWQITNTFNGIRTLDQQFNIVADYNAYEDRYKLLKLTSLPTVI